MSYEITDLPKRIHVREGPRNIATYYRLAGGWTWTGRPLDAEQLRDAAAGCSERVRERIEELIERYAPSQAEPTRVVSKHRADSWDVDIMRGTYKRPNKWGNPHRLNSRDELDVVECLLAHAEHVRESGLVEEVGELRGKVLACCCAPARCHGDTLARLADAADPRTEIDDIIQELSDERAAIRRVRNAQAKLF